MSFFLILLYTFFLAEECFIIFMTRAFSADYIVLPYKPNIPLIHSILSCKLFAYICKFLYLYIINLADIYA